MITGLCASLFDDQVPVSAGSLGFRADVTAKVENFAYDSLPDEFNIVSTIQKRLGIQSRLGYCEL